MARSGGDKRGRARDRQRRKVWMLHYFGDGQTCPCAHCGAPLTQDTIHQDRIIPGGSYARKNLLPSCEACNLARSDTPLEIWRAQCVRS